VRNYRTNGEHRVLNITEEGNNERTTPLQLEVVEKLAAWLARSHPASATIPLPPSSGRRA
jgi:hypothetical protein